MILDVSFMKRMVHFVRSVAAVIVLWNIWQNYYSAKVRSFHRITD
jgi:hypothetical protein